jgi:hypothetical protein
VLDKERTYLNILGNPTTYQVHYDSLGENMENLYSGLSGNNYVPGAGGHAASSLNATGARPGIKSDSGTHKNYSYLTTFKKGPKIKKALVQNTTYGVAYNNSEGKKGDRGYPVYKFNIK